MLYLLHYTVQSLRHERVVDVRGAINRCVLTFRPPTRAPIDVRSRPQRPRPHQTVAALRH